MIRTPEDQIISCKYLKDNGWTYDPETGLVYTKKGYSWKHPSIRTIKEDKTYIIVQKTFFAWFYMTGEIPEGIFIKRKDGDLYNNKWNNFTTEYKKKPAQSKKPRRAFNELSKLTQLKYRSYCPDRVPKDYIFNDKKKIKRIISPKKDKPLKPLKIDKPINYLNNNNLLYHIILSKGLGRLTTETETMFILIVKGLSSKLNYGFRTNTDYQDCAQDALLRLYETWMGFDELRYDNCLSYFTEIAKRRMAECKKKLEGQTYNFKPSFISINKYSQ